MCIRDRRHVVPVGEVLAPQRLVAVRAEEELIGPADRGVHRAAALLQLRHQDVDRVTGQQPRDEEVQRHRRPQGDQVERELAAVVAHRPPRFTLSSSSSTSGPHSPTGLRLTKIRASSGRDQTAGNAYRSSSLGQPSNLAVLNSLVVPPVMIGMYGMFSATRLWMTSKNSWRTAASLGSIDLSAAVRQEFFDVIQSRVAENMPYIPIMT